MPSGGKSMTAQRTRQLDGGACGLDQLPSRASASTGQWPQLDLGRLPAPSIARRWQAAHSRTTASRARPRTAAPKTRQYLAFAPARAASGLIRSRPRQRQTLDRGASGKLPTCARRHVRTASTASRAWRRQASSRHRAAMLSTCPVGPPPPPPSSARARSKNLAATAHTAQPHNHHAAPTAICPASCGKKPRWLVVCGALAWRVLSQRSLSQRPRPPARGASPLMWPDPPSTAAVLLSVRLGRHRATGADPATASRQTDPTWQPPQATTNQPPPTTSA
jgi:hypothetical protein